MENLNNENITNNTQSTENKKKTIKNLFDEPKKFIIPTFILSCICIVLSIINLGFNLNQNRFKGPRFDKMYAQNFNKNFRNNNSFRNNNNFNNNNNKNNNNNDQNDNRRYPESKGPTVQNENIEPRSPRK